MEPLRRFCEAPDRSFFLFGPRGTGKSTWLRQRFPGALWIDLLDPGTARIYQARPERILERVRGEAGRRVVVIDEVQRAPEILSAVHLLIEEDPGRQFVLTGSSARKLRRGGVNLLAGRAALRTMHPFLAAELGARFRLGDALRQGLVPLVVAAADPADVLRAYVALYLREEVQAEALVRRVGDFARFLEALSLSHGGVLNLSAAARECQVGRKTAEGYLGIVEDLLLAFRVPVFARAGRRALAIHPKLYLFDTGVFRALRPAGPLDRPGDIEGAALEGLVAQHLRAWAAYGGDAARLFFWRTRGGSEVDFVVYGPSDFAAIEVKSTAAVRPEDLRGLRAFREDHPEAAAWLLYRGRERLLVDGVRCLPAEEFLAGLRPGQRIDAAA